MAATFGLALGTVGLDPVSGTPRFTFGIFHLFDGFHPIVAIVGLFAISEVLVFLEHSHATHAPMVAVHRASARLSAIVDTFGACLRGSLQIGRAACRERG